MIFFFRVDFNKEVGLGHFVRCTKISSFISEKYNAEVLFISRSVTDLDISFLKLPNIEFISPKDITEDVLLTNNILSRFNGEKYLFVDSYNLANEWEKGVLSSCNCLVVIDDLANRFHDCDILTDCSPVRSANEYLDLVKPSTKLLLGSDYCPIASDILDIKGIEQRDNKIHVFFGSTIHHEKVFEYFKLLKSSLPSFSFNIALPGKLSPESFTLWSNSLSPDDALFMAQPLSVSLKGCSVGIGSPGIATWDRAFLNMRCFYISTNSNQEEILRKFEGIGFSFYLGKIDDSVDMNVKIFLEKLSLNPVKINQFKVDGKGIERILQEVLSYER